MSAAETRIAKPDYRRLEREVRNGEYPFSAEDEAALFVRAMWLEAELERLTVGRATLEDQTNRAELAEARVDTLESALRQIANEDNDSDDDFLVRGAIARAVLSGGSE